MAPDRSWATYPATYRAREMKILAAWISSGESGSVVGLSGSGRSNLLGFLCYRPEVLQAYLWPQAGPVVLVPVDLNNLPAGNLSTLYRAVLRSFYRTRDHFEASLQQTITNLYLENRAATDPFLPQSALQELLLLCQAQRLRVVLVLNRFDRFCQVATTSMVNTLRGLRDEFKNSLSYLVGMSQEAAYLPNPAALGDMYELLDSYVCWVGAMDEADARNLVARATQAAPVPPAEGDVAALLRLTGCYPALLRTACQWWLTAPDNPARADWPAALLAERNIRHRLDRLWAGLTQEEQFTLSELQKAALVAETPVYAVPDGDGPVPNRPADFTGRREEILKRLAQKGACCWTEEGWQIAGELLAAFVGLVEGRGRGRIWLDESTGEIFQGETPLGALTALERSLLTFLVHHPRVRHTKTDLIVNVWPDELRQEGVSDNSLYQVILGIRRHIEPGPGQVAYLITWRGKPEGGYQFFPEGRPG